MDVRLEFEDVGSERHGAVGFAVAVDAAIDAIVCWIWIDRCLLVAWRAMTFSFLNARRYGGAGRDGGRRLWQWRLGTEAVIDAIVGRGLACATDREA